MNRRADRRDLAVRVTERSDGFETSIWVTDHDTRRSAVHSGRAATHVRLDSDR